MRSSSPSSSNTRGSDLFSATMAGFRCHANTSPLRLVRLALARDDCVDVTNDTLRRYSPWFYAAALYNLIWGAVNIIFPSTLFRLISAPVPNYLPLWQVVGMFVFVFAPGYWWAARRPSQFPHLILIGMAGKVLGPVGFAISVVSGQLPVAFGLTILTN